MTQGKKLIKNTLIYSAGNFGSKILSFILVPIYTFFLSKSELGSYDLLLTTVNLFVPILTLQLSDAVYRWLLDAGDERILQKKSISTSLFVVGLTSVLFTIIIYIINFWINYPFVNLFILILVSSSFLPVCLSIIRGLGNTKFYSIMGLVNTLIIVILNIIYLYIFNSGLKGLFLSLIISNVFVVLGLFYFGKIYNYVSFRLVSKAEFVKLTRYSLPLVVNVISWWIINASDRYVIEFFLGISHNGIYAISVRFPSIILVINTVIMMSIQDYTLLMKNTKEEVDFSSKVFNQFVKIEMSIVILLTILSPFIVNHFVSEDFKDAWRYMPFLYIGVAFSAFSAYIGLAYQRNKSTLAVAYTTLLGACLNILVSVGLISKIGLFAPALGTFLSFLLIFTIRRLQTRNSFPIRIQLRSLMLLCLFQLFVTYIIFFYNKNPTIMCISILLSFGLLFVINMDNIKFFVRFVKNRK